MFDQVLNAPLTRAEAATGGVLLEKLFLEILQILQENTCAWVSVFKKLQALRKRHWHRWFSCEISEISKNTFFTEHLRTTAFARACLEWRKS